MPLNLDSNASSGQSTLLDSSQLMSSFDWMDIAIGVFNADGVTLDMNNQAIELYGIIDKEKFLSLKPNFFTCHAFRKSLDIRNVCAKDISSRVYFDFRSFANDFPGLVSKTGRAMHMLRIHPIYENGEKRPKMFIVFTTDLTSVKKQRETSHQLRDNLPFMMSLQGFSTWTYDIESGLRIPDMGADLFPDLPSMADFMAKLDQVGASALRSILNLIVSGEKMEGKATIQIRDKSRPLDLEVICTPQFIDGKVTGVFFLTKDVTARLKAERAVRAKEASIVLKNDSIKGTFKLMNSIVDKMPCLFFAKNVEKEFRYVMANSRFCELVGKGIGQVLQHTDKDILEDKFDKKLTDSDIKAIDRGSVSLTEETYFDGKKKVWQTMKYYIEIARLKLVVCMALDVTDIYNAYDEVKQAKLLAERSDKMKTVFLQNITHELVTPLNAVLGFAQLSLDPSSEEEAILYKKEITENTRILQDLLDEIVNLTKAESGILPSTIETFDLSSYLECLGGKYIHSVRKDVEFKIILPYEKCIVSLDVNRLTNIINRSITVTIENTYSGYIALGYELAEGGVKIFIEDTGIGLSENEIEDLVLKHENLNSFTEDVAFSFYICNILVKIMGGTIDITSSKNEKTRFSIFLPTKSATIPTAATKRETVRADISGHSF